MRGAGSHAGGRGFLGHGRPFPDLLGDGLVRAFFGAGEGRRGRFTGLVDAQFAADKVGGDLGHEPVGHQFSARDGDEAFQPVTLFVVETDDAAGDVAARGIVVCADKRAYACIGAKDAGGRKGGGQLGSLGDEQRHFIGRDGHVVTFFERNMGGGGADDADGVAGHQDVGVRGLAAAVDHHIVQAMGEDQQCALGRIHANMDAGQFRDLA